MCLTRMFSKSRIPENEHEKLRMSNNAELNIKTNLLAKNYYRLEDKVRTLESKVDNLTLNIKAISEILKIN